MIIERPTSQPTTERVAVCDWCGKDKGDGSWRSGFAFWFTLGNDLVVIHEDECWPAFMAKHRAAIGLKPLGGDDADLMCVQTDCRHPQSWHAGHYNYDKLGMVCMCRRLKVEDADPICIDMSCQHPRSAHPGMPGATTVCQHYAGFKA